MKTVDEPGRMSEGSVGKGLAIGGVLTLAGLAAGWLLLTSDGSLILVGIGLAQLLWLLPAILYYRGQDEPETAKGLMIVGGVVFLLNASCWGLVLSGKWRIGG
jgi:hypothetical protein